MALMARTKLFVCLLPVTVCVAVGRDGTCSNGDACEHDTPKQASVLSPPADFSALFQIKTAQVLTALVPPTDDRNMASAPPRNKKLMELNATVHDIQALGKAAATPEFTPIITDLVHVIENELQEKVKDDQTYAQSKVTERLAGLTETTDIAVEDKGDADEIDTSLDQCITEEQRLLQAYENCKSEEAVLVTEKASAEYCDHPDLEIASEYKDPPQLESSLTVDFSQGLHSVQQQLDDYLDPVKQWIDTMKKKAVGDQVKWDAADLRCNQKTKELEDKTTECGEKLGAWRPQRETCLHAKSEQQQSLCAFGHSYQTKCAAKTAFDNLETDITGTGTSFSQPDREQEWRLTTKLVCVLNVLKDYIDGAVDTCTKSDDEAAKEFEKDVGAIDLKQTTYVLLTSQAKFTCAEANIGFASGLLWTVPENTDGAAEWIPSSTDYTKATGYKYAIESDSSHAPFDFCLGKSNHPTAPTCGSTFDCTTGAGLWQQPGETQCYLAGGCTSADCCGGTVQAVFCGTNNKVVDHVCVVCPAGKTSTGQHDTSGSDTSCDATDCVANEKVVNHVCVECPAGKTSTGHHDASGSNTFCDATDCGANEKVVNHVCVECPPGKTSTGNHDASGSNTFCDATSCGQNEKVVNHKCVACPGGKTSMGNHDASGSDTSCEVAAVYVRGSAGTNVCPPGSVPLTLASECQEAGGNKWQVESWWDTYPGGCFHKKPFRADGERVFFNRNPSGGPGHDLLYSRICKKASECWIRMPSGCSQMTTEPNVWIIDPWFSKGLSGNAAKCTARKTNFNGYCSTSDAQSQWGLPPQA